jgi:hypothetical protein
LMYKMDQRFDNRLAQVQNEMNKKLTIKKIEFFSKFQFNRS